MPEQTKIAGTDVCEQKGCSAAAEWIVYWPGKTTRQCKPHSEQTVGVGNAMGFQVTCTPIVQGEG